MWKGGLLNEYLYTTSCYLSNEVDNFVIIKLIDMEVVELNLKIPMLKKVVKPVHVQESRWITRMIKL